MSIVDGVKGWVFNIALKKAVVSAAKLIVSYCLAKGVSLSFTIGGVPVNTTDEAALTVAINSGLTVLRNWLKVNYPAKFGWL